MIVGCSWLRYVCLFDFPASTGEMEDGGGDGSSGIGTGTVGGKHNKGKGVQNQTRLEADIRREQARKALQDGDPAEEFPFPQVMFIF